MVDLRPTNAYCVRRSCKYETLKSLSRWAAKGSWAFSWDMKDGYHQVGVAREHRRYMTFALPPAPGSPPGTPPRYIRSAALPFGWCDSPRVFSKVMKVMVRMLRSPWAPGLPRLRHSTRSGRAYVLRCRARGRNSPELTGMRLLPYVDDFLALAATKREALRCRERVARVLELLGLTRHSSKGDWEPTQRLERHRPQGRALPRASAEAPRAATSVPLDSGHGGPGESPHPGQVPGRLRGNRTAAAARSATRSERLGGSTSSAAATLALSSLDARESLRKGHERFIEEVLNLGDGAGNDLVGGGARCGWRTGCGEAVRHAHAHRRRE